MCFKAKKDKNANSNKKKIAEYRYQNTLLICQKCRFRLRNFYDKYMKFLYFVRNGKIKSDFFQNLT